MKSMVVVPVFMSLVLFASAGAWAEGGVAPATSGGGEGGCSSAADCLQKGHERMKQTDKSGKTGNEAAAEYFVKACNFKEYRGCTLAGIALKGKEPAEAKMLLDRACKSGDQLGCALLKYGWNPKDGRPEKDKVVAKNLKKECKSGGVHACLYLGAVMQWKDDRFPPRYNGFRPYYKKACDGGSGMGCDLLARTYHIDIAGCEKPDCRFRSQSAAVEYFLKGCDLGHAEACRMAGAILTDPEEPEKKLRDPKKGVEVFNKACEMKDAYSCVMLADLLSAGKVVEKSPDDARKYYALACKAGLSEACNR